MPRVVPSVVRRAIERMFPEIIKDPLSRPGFDVDVLPAFAAVVDLADAIPPTLLRVEPAQYAEFTACVAAIRGAADMYASARLPRGHALNVRGFEKHPIAVIYETLVACPDAAASENEPALPFIEDRQFAETLRVDMNMATTALGNGEWKAVTVLAGSVIEALLLWAITRHQQADWEQAMHQVVAANLIKGRKDHPENWHLPEYIEVAAGLGCITTGTRDEARRTKEYRNLIHPGRVQRTGQQCDLGTAHIAIGTIDHVIHDLANKGVEGRCP